MYFKKERYWITHKNGSVITTCSDFEKAKRSAKILTKLFGVTVWVYDSWSGLQQDLK